MFNYLKTTSLIDLSKMLKEYFEFEKDFQKGQACSICDAESNQFMKVISTNKFETL